MTDLHCSILTPGGGVQGGYDLNAWYCPGLPRGVRPVCQITKCWGHEVQLEHAVLQQRRASPCWADCLCLSAGTIALVTGSSTDLAARYWAQALERADL